MSTEDVTNFPSKISVGIDAKALTLFFEYGQIYQLDFDAEHFQAFIDLMIKALDKWHEFYGPTAALGDDTIH